MLGLPRAHLINKDARALGLSDLLEGTVPRRLTRTFDRVGSRCSDGELVPRYEVVEVSGDLAYTVGFEHGTVRVDGSEARPMTIRVTHVFKRIEDDWWLVHRHADFPPPDQRRG